VAQGLPRPHARHRTGVRRAATRSRSIRATPASSSTASARLARRRMDGTRGLRHARHPLRRPPRPAKDPHVERLRQLPAAQGLPARGVGERENYRSSRAKGRDVVVAAPSSAVRSDPTRRFRHRQIQRHRREQQRIDLRIALARRSPG
jgi:hypothetical protein